MGQRTLAHWRSVIFLIWRPDGRLVAIDRQNPGRPVTTERAEEVLKALKKAYRACFDHEGHPLHAPGTYREGLDEDEYRRLAQFDLTLLHLSRMIHRSTKLLAADPGPLTHYPLTPFTRPLIDPASA